MKKRLSSQAKIVDVLIIGDTTYAATLTDSFEALGKKVLHTIDTPQSPVRCIAPKLYSVQGKRYTANATIITSYSELDEVRMQGLDKTPHATSAAELLLTVKKPQSVIVCLSSGGSLQDVLDLAAAGWSVDVIQGESRPLFQYDTSISDYMKRVLKLAKVRILDQATPMSTIKTPRGIFVVTEQFGVPKRLKAEYLVVQPARREVIDIGLINSGNEKLAKGIYHEKTPYAVFGDITYIRPDVYLTLEDISTITQNCLSKSPLKKKISPTTVHSFTDTKTCYVSVGVTELELSSSHTPYSKGFVVIKDQATGKQSGFVKVLARYNGQLLGVSCVHHEAFSYVPLWAHAVSARKKVYTLLDFMEPGKEIAEAYIAALDEL